MELKEKIDLLKKICEENDIKISVSEDMKTFIVLDSHGNVQKTCKIINDLNSEHLIISSDRKEIETNSVKLMLRDVNLIKNVHIERKIFFPKYKNKHSHNYRKNLPKFMR